MRRNFRSTTIIFARRSIRRIEARLCRSKVRLELEFVGIDAKPKVHRRVLLLLPPLHLLLPSRAEPPIMVRNLRRRRRNPPLPARLESVSASPIPPSRRSTSGVPTRSSSRGEDAELDNPLQAMAISGRPYSIDCDGRRPFLGSAADRGKAASWAPRAGGLGSPTVETWEGRERKWGRIISTMP